MNLKRLLLPVVLVPAFATAGCGADPGTAVVEADTEGVWVDVGPLDYHIQGSRQLNPSQVPDDRYLQGVDPAVKPPTGRETWFAVFLRIENKSGKSAPTADAFDIEDTEGNKYEPIGLADTNPFVYRPQTLTDGAVMPAPDSSQEFDSTAGSMLLFKLPLTTVANRPLEFTIHAPAGSAEPADAEVDLDV